MEPKISTYYKYLDAEGLVKSIQGMSLQWKDPRLFNDPFDCHCLFMRDVTTDESKNSVVQAVLSAAYAIDHPKFQNITQFRRLIRDLRANRARVPRSEAEKRLKEIANATFDTNSDLLRITMESNERVKGMMRILCLGSSPDVLLMWSHYARAYEGGVIALTPRPGSSSQIASAKKVRYTAEVPELLNPEHWGGFITGMYNPPFKELLMDAFLHKCDEWEYEHEYRCFYNLDIPSPHDNNGVLLVPLTDEISAIYLGARVKAETKRKVQQAMEAHGLRVPLYEMQLPHARFGIDFVQIR